MTDRADRPGLPLLCLVAWVVSMATAASAQDATPSNEWMAHCSRNLAPAQLPERIVRKYCTCMAGIGEEDEMLTWSQGELERSYPPAHVQCHQAARRR